MVRANPVRAFCRKADIGAFATEHNAMDPHDLALAYVLSTVAGIRASMTLLALTFAAHFHAIVPPEHLAWIARDETFGIAAVLTVAEIISDKVPLVDHALHALHAVLAPLVGATAVAAVDPAASGLLPAFATIGAGNAFGVQTLRAATRIGSSAVSLGMLNPIVSLGEDGIAVLGLVLAFAAPAAAALTALSLTIVAFVFVRRIGRRRAPA